MGLCGCGVTATPTTPTKASNKPTIVCTTFAAYDAARVLNTGASKDGESHYEVLYCPISQDAEFKLTEETKGELDNAHIIIHNGESALESYLSEKNYTNANNKIIFSLEAAVSTAGGNIDVPTDEFGKIFGETQIEVNPVLLQYDDSCIWLPIEAMAYIVQYTADRMIADTKDGNYYSIAMEYLSALAKVDTEYLLLLKDKEFRVYMPCKFENFLQYYEAKYSVIDDKYSAPEDDKCDILIDNITPIPSSLDDENVEFYRINTMEEDFSQDNKIDITKDSYLGFCEENFKTLQKAIKSPNYGK